MPPRSKKRQAPVTAPSTISGNSNRAYYDLVRDYLGSELPSSGSTSNNTALQGTLDQRLKRSKRPKRGLVADINSDSSLPRQLSKPSTATRGSSSLKRKSKAEALSKERERAFSGISSQRPNTLSGNNVPGKSANSIAKKPITKKADLTQDINGGDDGDDDGDDEDSDDFDDEEFEDVEIRPVSQPLTPTIEPSNDTIAVTIRARNKSKKPRSRANVVSKEERLQRKKIHMMHLTSMILYGKLRNQWLNDRQLQLFYSNIAPKKIYGELHPSLKDKSMSSAIKSRYFLDGLRHLMEFWIRQYNITLSTGIFKLQWDEIFSETKRKALQRHTEKVNKKVFLYNLSTFSGNRDLGAQGYVALLRSLQVRARLVFSIQPPDFTVAAPVQSDNLADGESESDEYDKDEAEKAKSRKRKVNANNKPKRSNLNKIPKLNSSVSSNPQSLLHRIINSHHKSTSANDLNTYHIEKILRRNPYLSPYPVFWAEAWNPFSKKWITIDPVNFRIVEDIQRQSKLEPPMADERNTLLYAIAFDKKNGIKDVSRRYASYFNSKTRKKRITRDNKGNDWYNHLLESMSNPEDMKPEIEMLENDYFAQRNIKEGMPTSIGDFRNHPVYAIESQLRSNEILYPRNPCGYVQQKAAGKHAASIAVYNRENVQELKSARGWFHKGRVINVGQRALRMKQKKQQKNQYSQYKFKKRDDEDEDDNEKNDEEDDDNVRLYAEFQTEPYVPEPIKDGKVPKNAYGNIDVYTDNMIPAGGALITSKFATQAAKLLGIDYSPAVVGFNFGYRSSTKPKIGGVVVAKEYEEAVNIVNEHLEEQDIELQRRQTANKAIKAWKLVFAKLRIVERLERMHGEVAEDEGDLEAAQKDLDIDLSSDSEEDPYNAGDRYDNSEEVDEGGHEVDAEVYGGGGFLPTDVDQDTLRQKDRQKLQERRDARRKKEQELQSSDDELAGLGQHYEDDHEQSALDQGQDANIGAEAFEGGGFFLQDDDNLEEDVANHVEDKEDLSESFEGGGFFIETEENPMEERAGKSNIGKTFASHGAQNLNDEEMLDEDFVYDPGDEERIQKEQRHVVGESKGKEPVPLQNAESGNDDAFDNDHHEESPRDVYSKSSEPTPGSSDGIIEITEDVNKNVNNSRPFKEEEIVATIGTQSKASSFGESLIESFRSDSLKDNGVDAGGDGNDGQGDGQENDEDYDFVYSDSE